MGVKDSYKIIALDIDGMTLKLYAIAKVVRRLIKKIYYYTSRV